MTLVPASSHGGAAGFAIGSSSLLVQSSGIAGQAMGVVTNVTWGEAPVIVGSDISVHAADKSLIDFATAGFYTATAVIWISSTTATVGHAEGTVGWPAAPAMESQFSADYQEWVATLTTAPTHFAAGDQARFTALADNAASTGTYDVGGASYLFVTRLA